MKKHILCIALITGVLTLVNCGGSDDGGETDEPVVIAPDPIPSQTSTYTNHVKAIIDANCIDCHSDPPTRQAPMALVTFDQVVDAENNRDLYGRIFTSSFTRVMPPNEEGGRLPDATVLIVEDWIADGMLE